MKPVGTLFLLSLFVASMTLAQSSTRPGVVNTTGGAIAGTSTDDGAVHVFKGVPFAAPPVSDLRWREPQPVVPWKGTRTCDQFSASPVQNKPAPFMMWTEEFISPPEPLSEDCLYLNIWTPTLSPAARLPVLVWIYGGGFVSGSAACAVYDGEAMARKGIIFVSINYRVGIFGFMAHPELTKESGNNSSGNYALLDQLAALKWVQANIAAFGGDPAKVTIAGQSAGSFSVQSLVASPLSKGLFRGAIAQSGASLDRLSTPLATAEKTGEAVAAKTKRLTLASLRKLAADSLLQIANTFPFGSFAPIVDGYVLPADMRTIFATKRQQDVALLAGWVMGDAALAGQPMTMEKFQAFAENTFGKKKDEFLKLFPAQTEEQTKQSQTIWGLLNFAGQADHTWALSNASPSFLYQYTYVPTDKPGFPNYGAFHTSEVPYAFHTLAKWNRPWTPTDLAVEKYMSDYWVNFVKNGDPNGPGLPAWKAYSAQNRFIMELGAMPSLKQDLYRAELSFLESIRR